MDSRSDGGEVQEERVELSGPRVVRRAVKLRFGGVGAPGPAPAAAQDDSPPPIESRAARAPNRASSRPPPEMQIELRSVPPQRGTRLRRLPSLRPRGDRASVEPGSATDLWPGVALLLASIAIGLAGHALDFELGPVRPAWVAGTLMVAGISLLVYQLWPRDR